MAKPILCLDFDGVIHSYTSGWKSADVIPDPPVPGAFSFIREAAKHFTIAIYSSRSGQSGGIAAMQRWIEEHDQYVPQEALEPIMAILTWPTEKPPALLTIDDRVWPFEGVWPDPSYLLTFKPWNKRDAQRQGR